MGADSRRTKGSISLAHEANFDFPQTRQWLEKTMQDRGDDYLDFGGVQVLKDITGRMLIHAGKDLFPMDMMPAEIFDRLSSAIASYNSLSVPDGLQTEMFPK